MKALARKLIARVNQRVNRLPGDKRDDSELYAKTYGREAVKNRCFYNISAGGHLGFGGNFTHPCWTNIDVDIPWPRARGFDSARDIAHDLLNMDPLPLESGTAHLVQCRFTIEHVTNAAAEVLFREVYRILKPGGTFRVSCPDIDLDYRAYLKGDISYFWWHCFGPDIPSIEQAMLHHFAASISRLDQDGAEERMTDDEFRTIIHSYSQNDALDLCIARCPVEVQKRHRHSHMNWWNEGKLIGCLSNAGFRSCYRSGARQSACQVLRNGCHFDNLFNEVALYAEAVK